MYIVQTGESWRDKPFLYAKPGRIGSKEEIAEILRQGFLEAFYDPDRSEQPKEGEPDLLASRQVDLPEPKIPLREELKAQEIAYTNCVDSMQHIMEEARGGHLDFKSAEPLMSDIVDSVYRNSDALTSLSKIKTHDEYTFAHCVNVSIFSVVFGRHLGFAGEELQRLGMSALFHDIGKMRVPPTILNAPRSLTSNEFAIMQKHAQIGAEMLAELPGIGDDILSGVAEHHERYNGQGYPHKKKGRQISPFGCIISVCDVYDALSSKRVYKEAIPPTKALSIMYGMRGEAWEPGLVELFIKILGIYPVGTPITLTSGLQGIVTHSNPQAPLYPQVLLCRDRNGRHIKPPASVDLAQQHEFQIIKALDKKTVSFDVLSILTEESVPHSS
ncbi:MAG: HD-GYP domain-containing protein [Desulfovibrio sp.]|nr:HD-GYP domain-containing protein [Desulfovibrio sp.]